MEGSGPPRSPRSPSGDKGKRGGHTPRDPAPRPRDRSRGRGEGKEHHRVPRGLLREDRDVVHGGVGVMRDSECDRDRSQDRSRWYSGH